LNNLVKLAAACCAAVALAGCGNRIESGTAGPELPGSANSGAETAAQAGPQVNERGFIVKQLGEEACFGGGDKCEGGVSFAVDKVEVDPPCAEYGSPPENAHTLLLHIRVATGTDTEAIDRVGGIINPFSFVEIGADGVTRPASFGICADSSANKLPDTYGPSQQYSGVLELEVPTASGTVAIQMAFADEDGQQGWEWTYPV
jgi:hypothetical protein